jgi:hypothetical protein
MPSFYARHMKYVSSCPWGGGHEDTCSSCTGPLPPLEGGKERKEFRSTHGLLEVTQLTGSRSQKDVFWLSRVQCSLSKLRNHMRFIEGGK